MIIPWSCLFKSNWFVHITNEIIKAHCRYKDSALQYGLSQSCYRYSCHISFCHINFFLYFWTNVSVSENHTGWLIIQMLLHGLSPGNKNIPATSVPWSCISHKMWMAWLGKVSSNQVIFNLNSWRINLLRILWCNILNIIKFHEAHCITYYQFIIHRIINIYFIDNTQNTPLFIHFCTWTKFMEKYSVKFSH